jgi:hypothetical protein
MPATQSPARSRSKSALSARAQDDANRLDRINESLEAAQKDLASIGGSVGTGMRDLRRDATRLLRDARRDLLKMRRSLQHDLDRLQRDLTSATTGKPVQRGATAARTRSGTSRQRAVRSG